ncbi:hypothetical protein [Flavobacterium beibuense]|uniref:Uncharacterized protein n=1 Tax=Flavobacterium beibuense TaxID=657326 RepID=A0A444W735_9FLAO|nr:hypothetical protein [Flavobacterium beibuense]RYJ41593.1 hypothetical protein NU09_2967 [Flavobacterium beibuense]
MKKLEMPLFNNSCGKLFNDKIVLASAHREEEIEFKEIKKIKFGFNVSLKSVMWALMPSSIFVLLYLQRAMLDGAMFILLSFVAIGISVFSVVMAEKSYYVLIKLRGGQNVKVRVSVDNKKDAKKFADMAIKRLSRVSGSTGGLKVVKEAA